MRTLMKDKQNLELQMNSKIEYEDTQLEDVLPTLREKEAERKRRQEIEDYMKSEFKVDYFMQIKVEEKKRKAVNLEDFIQMQQ